MGPSHGLAEAAEPFGIHGPEAAVEDGKVQGLLGAKMVGGRAEIDTGGICKHAHADAIVAALAKQLLGSIQELVGSVGDGFDSYGHVQLIHTYELNVKLRQCGRAAANPG